MITYVFIECQNAHQHPARRVRHTDHIEISLQTSVLARSTVYRYISEVKMPRHAILLEAKIILINWCMFPARKYNRPFIPLNDGNI